MEKQDKGRAYSDDSMGYFGQLVGSAVATHGPEAAKAFCSRFIDLYMRSESPIETYVGVLLAALAELTGLKVTAQKHVPSGYRLDFLVECPKWKVTGLVIECDGHEFHERTREQAARDRKRDRDLTSDGFVVLRFTGSEIVSQWDVVCADISRAIDKLDAEADS